MSSFWDKRYSEETYVYGETPNVFYKEQIDYLTAAIGKGSVLFAAEGEGRNAVYAARLGWHVKAFDQSVSGRSKALSLAEKYQVSIDYEVSGLEEIVLTKEGYEVLVLVFAHFPEQVRRDYHQKLAQAVKKGGILILEGFSKAHQEKQKVNAQVGGPGDPTMLFDLDEIKEDFKAFSFSIAEEVDIKLAEGAYHQGEATVIRLVGKKQ